MPRFAVFVASADTGTYHHNAFFQQRSIEALISRLNTRIEAAVSVNQHRIVTIQFETLFVDHKCRNLRTVFRGIEYDFPFDAAHIDRQFTLIVESPFEVGG